MAAVRTTPSLWAIKWEGVRRAWYKFSRNLLSIVGLVTVLTIALVAIFAPFLAPYPQHAGSYVNFKEAGQPPSLKHPFGTDVFGRDILSRVMFGYRFSLMMGIVVLSLVVPPGVILGLLAGYMRGTTGS